jgi:arylsulfatase A-like enzyme
VKALGSPLRLASAVLAALLFSLPCLGQIGWERPLNVLVVMTDQHNARALGHTDNGFGGVPSSLTPNLDALAAGGTRFDAAFCATPQCSPSRFTVLTGRWPHDHGLRWNGIWEPHGQVTFPRLARAAGYVTATIGKHHFNWLLQSAPLVEDHGFDLVIDWSDYSNFCASRSTPTFLAPGRYWAMPGLFNERGGGYHLPWAGFTLNTNELHPAGFWADQAIRFLEQRAGPGGDGQPFLLYYSMVGPHPPMLPTGSADPQDWAHIFHPYSQLALAPNLNKVATTTRLAIHQGFREGMTPEQHREALSYYYGLINQIDWNIGRVLARLESLGLADETIVVFTADHGEMATEMGCWAKGAGSYEALTRVPLIVRLPGTVQQGLVSEALVSNIDLVPTLLELTGVPIETADRAFLPGASLAPILAGDGTPSGWRDRVFIEQGDPHAIRFLRSRTIRTATTKFVQDEMGGGESEFYDLALDPWEIEDLSSDPARQAEIAGLSAELDAWWDDEQGHAPHYTVSGPASAAPSPSAYPTPVSEAVAVPRNVDLSWVPSTAAATIEVWLGRSPSQMALVATLPPMSDTFNPGTLEPGLGYYWRVDGTNENGVTVGPVWRFRTAIGPGGPALARDPMPHDRSEGVPLSAVLGWTSGHDTILHQLFFGPAGAMQPVAVLMGSATSYDPGRLAAGVTYEWRLDGYSMDGRTEGTVWSFTTDSQGLAQLERTSRYRS